MDDEFSERAFPTRAVWSGTNHLEGSAVTPIFTTSTYQLNDDRYRDWADGGQHLSLIHISEPTRPERIGVGGGGV